MTEAQARRIALIAFAVWATTHVFWTFRSQVNWDEFALLARAHDSLVQGQLAGGGRPGLSTLLLMPIVEGCSDALRQVRVARLVWTPFVLAILFAFWLVLSRVLSDRDHCARDTLVGVSLFALAPPFLIHSLQVRTDQPAIALGLLGGAALLAPRRNLGNAAVAGCLLGLGYASSQKLLYVAALVGCLALADLLRRREFAWRRDPLRATVLLGAAVLTVVAFRASVSMFMEPAPVLTIEGQLNVFSYYRETFGYQFYADMAPFLLVPLGLLVLVLVRLPAAFRSERQEERGIATMLLAVAALGIAVAAFHAGAFPYFWMTLGLFPAAAVAIGLPLVRRWLEPRSRGRLALAATALLALPAFLTAASLSRDGQAIQRDALDFARANFDPSVEGFHDTRALFCRDGDRPFGTYFSHVMGINFYEREASGKVDSLVSEFRTRPVAFIIRTFRDTQFPQPVQDFWSSHYVPYHGPVMVPGRALSNKSAHSDTFEVIVPGEYVLHAESPDATIQVDGQPLRPGSPRYLDRGIHTISPPADADSALLTIALPEPPGPTTDDFYGR